MKILPVQFQIAIRNLFTRPWRTLLTMMGVTLGVAVVLAVEVTNRSTMASVEGMFNRAVGQAELLVIPPGDEPTLDGKLLGRVGRTPDVAAAAPALSERTALLSDVEDTFTVWSAQGVQVGRDFEVRGIDPQLDPLVRVYVLAAGRLPTSGCYEAALPQRYAHEEGLKLGGELEVVTPNGPEKLDIVGLLADEGAAMTNSGAVAFVPLEVVQKLFNEGGELSEIAVQAAPGIGSNLPALEALKSKLAERIGTAGHVIYPSARGDLVPRMLGSYQMGLQFFSVIAIFTGAFLIYNTFSMTVVERTQEIGMLRAIGMGRSQVLTMVLAEAFVLGILGSMTGLAAGSVMARSLTVIVGGFVAASLAPLTVIRQDLVMGLGVGIGVTLLAALLPAHQATSTTPLEALRVQSRTGQKVRPTAWIAGLLLIPIGWAFIFKVPIIQPLRIPVGLSSFIIFLLGVVLTIPLAIGLLERIVRLLITAVYGTEGALGSSNVSRSVLRSTLTVASLMISLIMIIGVGSMAQTITRDMQSWVDNAMGGDLIVTAGEPQRDTFTDTLAKMPGVSAVSPVRVMEVRVGAERYGTTYLGRPRREKLYFFAIDPVLYRQIGDKEFVSGQGDGGANWADLENGGALFISSIVAEEYQVGKGDTLSLITRHGEQPFRIAGVTTEFTRQGYLVTGTFADLQRWFGETGANQFTLKAAPEYEAAELADVIKERYQTRYNLKIQTTQTYRSSLLGLLLQATQSFQVLSLVGVVIGAMGVLNTMSMNVLERQREIGGLRSLGMVRGQVVRLVLAEALTLGMVGALYGLVFGNAASHIFLYGINAISSYELDYLFSPYPYLESLVVALCISQLSAIIPARRAAGINIIEALKHE